MRAGFNENLERYDRMPEQERTARINDLIRFIRLGLPMHEKFSLVVFGLTGMVVTFTKRGKHGVRPKARLSRR